ncbi:MAG: DNA translocase FtsK, partial [Huintestinicola sp.]
KPAPKAPEKPAENETIAAKKDVASATKHKQSTLASDKINTTEELDMPDAPTAADIQNEIAENKKEAFIYKFPPISLLKQADNERNSDDAEAEMKANADTLVDTLKSFGVQTRIVDIHRGPTVTRYELQPSAGVKISKITSLSDDIALNLAAAGVRIEAPIPGKAAVGIEVPNKVKDTVSIREMIESEEFASAKSKLSFVVGKNIDGEVIIGDIGKMPHVIIAGTTGSGKSVCTNSIIMSILYNASPDEVRLVLIDPKMVEFKTYDGIPHLLIPVVTDPRKAAGALSWAVQEMLKRYKLFADSNVRDLNGYNEMAAETEGVEPLPRIVIAIDELADLMMACSNEVEDSICRLAQMARAAGMHLIIATQRPTVDVITGLIKANIPSRIALTVSSQIDSRTIIDQAGAEKLLGYGDMLYYPQGIPKPIRVQGCFVSTKEVESVVEFIKSGGTVEYSTEIMEEIEKAIPVPKGEKGGDNSSDVPTGDGSDADVIDRAVEVLCDAGQASVSYLQRKLKLGYARAARVMDQLEELGVVGPYEGSKP